MVVESDSTGWRAPLMNAAHSHMRRQKLFDSGAKLRVLCTSVIEKTSPLLGRSLLNRGVEDHLDVFSGCVHGSHQETRPLCTSAKELAGFITGRKRNA